MSESLLRRCASPLLVVLFGALAACADDTTPYGRTKDYKDCASLFELLAPNASANKQLDRIRVAYREIPEGGFYLTKDGTAVFRDYGTNEKDVEIVSPEASKEAIAEFVRRQEQRGREVVVAGDMPLDRLYERMRDIDLGPSAKRIYFTIDPARQSVEAKRRLLEREFKRVEIIVDVQMPSPELQESLRATLTGDVMQELTKDLGAVKFISLQDLPGEGKLAQRLLASRPTPDTVRITVTHHSAGEALLSDGSRITIKALGEKRIADGDMDIYAGCHLVPDENGWLLIDGKLVGREIAALGEDLSNTFAHQDTVRGRDILGVTSRLETAPPNGPPPGGGDNGRPPGGTGGEDASAADSSGAPGERTATSKRRFLRLLEIAALSYAALSEDEASAEENDDDSANRDSNGGFIVVSVDLGPSKLHIGAQSPWWSDPSEVERVKDLILPTVQDRPVLLLLEEKKKLLFFEPSRTNGPDIPAPLLVLSLTGQPNDNQLSILRDQASRFWFLSSDNVDEVKTRQLLLDWQDRIDVTLPFIFIAEPEKPTSDSWTMLKPFFESVSHVGEYVPEQEDDGEAMGLFWCHNPKERLGRYTGLSNTLAAGNTAKNVDLRRQRAELSKELGELLHRTDPNVWLIGVWTDNGLRQPNGTYRNKEWVDVQSCEARITFASIAPISAPMKGRYYEPDEAGTIPRSIEALSKYARDEKAFFEIQGELEALYKDIKSKNAVLAISSCGKYLLISE